MVIIKKTRIVALPCFWMNYFSKQAYNNIYQGTKKKTKNKAKDFNCKQVFHGV
jgi:hypothetical protein